MQSLKVRVPKVSDEEELVKVTFTVKEMFGEVQKDIAAGFQRVEGKLDTKADKSELDKVQTMVVRHAERIEGMESWQRAADIAKNAVDSKVITDNNRRQRFWNYALGLATTAGTAGLIVAAFVVH
jgi:hypothetical protein